MKPEIKLQDPKYCNGCPCSNCLIQDDTIAIIGCNIFDDALILDETGHVHRPQICKDKNGE